MTIIRLPVPGPVRDHRRRVVLASLRIVPGVALQLSVVRRPRERGSPPAPPGHWPDLARGIWLDEPA
ncbi:MAG: hypothetical protein HOQ45_03375 [Nocardioidaceae bacterium]|nr:hypothetical protein [Nocardioidaceae bacterium]